MHTAADGPVIGLFDSGVGGLSVLRAVRAQVPQARLLYLADQAHVPYGRRSRAQIRAYARGITRFLLAQGVQVIVVACNTATAAAIDTLRAEFPGVPFVGIEPAVKPAAQATRRGVVGVLATQATFRQPRYATLVRRFAPHVRVLEDPCPGLVERIEAGEVDGPQVRAILRRAVGPMLQAGADTFVLGCTHYPFARAALQDLVGPEVRILDPAPAVARQVVRVLARLGWSGEPGSARAGEVAFFTTGDPAALAAAVQRLLGWPRPSVVTPLRWQGAALAEAFPRLTLLPS